MFIPRVLVLLQYLPQDCSVWNIDPEKLYYINNLHTSKIKKILKEREIILSYDLNMTFIG